MSVAIDYQLLSERVTNVLRREFGPNVTVRTDQGWQGRVHVKIVSDAFDGLGEDEKQEMVWKALRDELGPDSQAVSVVLPYGTDEI